MPTTTNDGSGATDVSGTWDSETNAYDGSATTYATTTNTTTTHVLDITGFDFASVIPSNATAINSIVVNVQQYYGNVARWDPPTIRAYDGVTALGSGAYTLTERATAGNEDATLAGTFTVAAVRSANFKLTFSATRTSGTGSTLCNFGRANVTVDYSAPTTHSIDGSRSVTESAAGAISKTSAVTTTAQQETVARAGAVAKTSTLAGTVQVTATAAAVIDLGAPTVDGALPVTATPAGAVEKTSTVAGSRTVTATFAGAVDATKTVAGSLTVTETVAAAVDKSTSLAGSLSVTTTAAAALEVVGGSQTVEVDADLALVAAFTAALELVTYPVDITDYIPAAPTVTPATVGTRITGRTVPVPAAGGVAVRSSTVTPSTVPVAVITGT